MNLYKTMREYWLFGLTLTLILPFVACAAGTDSAVGADGMGGYRFTREPGTTKDGYSLPLT